MADKLRDSFFLRDRVINFTASLLGGNGRGELSAITEFEKKLLLNREALLKLNGELDGKLIELLSQAKDYIPPHTALRVLLYLQTLGYVTQGHQMIYFAARDQQALSDEEVAELVAEIKKDPEVQIEWYVALLSNGETPTEDNSGPRPGLDLPLDFK